MSPKDKSSAKKPPKDTHKTIGVTQIFKYATCRENICACLGLFGAIVSSFGWPLLNIVFGEIVDLFVKFELDIGNASTAGNQTEAVEDELRSQFMSSVYLRSGQMLVVALLYIIGNYIMIFSFNRFSLRLVRSIKQKYVDSLLRQETAWHDTKQSGEFATTISGHFKKFENGTNENMGMLVNNLMSTVFNVTVAMLYGWKLALVIISSVPIMGIFAFIISKFQKRFQHRESKADEKACAALEEIFSAIRTVFAFNGQRKETERYRTLLRPATKNAILRHHVNSYITASTWTIMFFNMGIGLVYGVYLNHTEGYKVGDIVIVFWSAIGGGFGLSNAAPYYESFQTARVAGASIYEVIERKSRIDSADPKGKLVPTDFKANIQLKDVHFCYPTRPDVPILQGVDLSIAEGETIAIVGSSGSGKSTIIQLVQRFYDADKGGVLVDGVDIKDYNLGSLRQQLGVMGQEAILFDGTIEENIRLGLPLGQMDAKQEVIVKAAKQANAHKFIKSLPDGYKTYVGDRGTQLSGGQKQRIAIARALVSNPAILLLDESTSALDNESEKLVQRALDQASEERTTIIVAHRLSTIRNADRIIYLEHGKIIETGTHEELMEKAGAYYKLVCAQQVSGVEEEKPLEKEEGLQRQISADVDYRMSSEELFSKKTNNEEEKKAEIERIKQASFPYGRMASYLRSDTIYLVIAMLSAFLYGVIIPIYAIYFGNFIDIFTVSSDYDYRLSTTLKYAYFFFALGVVSFVANVGQTSLFGFISERLIKRLRVMAFKSLMNQEMVFFDSKENTPGALVSRLSEDVANIQGATGMRIGMLCSIVSTCLCALSTSFSFNWMMSLVSLAICPLTVSLAFLSARFYSEHQVRDSKVAEKLGKLLIEVLNGKRTVDSLHKREHFYNKANVYIEEHYEVVTKNIIWRILVVSLSFSSLFLAYSITFLFGGFLMSKELLTSGDFFRVIESIIISAQVIGNAAILSADFAKAKLGAHSFFQLIDRKTSQNFESVEASASSGQKQYVKGNISVKGVHFHYPNRPGVSILNGISLEANAGQTVALVGESGCGKSTIACQLLEQFYQPTSGKILIDDQDITSFDVNWIRSQMALVQQEPILFSYSIRDNIAYGDNGREDVPFDEIVRAAQMANIHEFIKQLPEGYDTKVGSKGSQLSGGQKQRIAIARSLVRDPAILLLDEATSALDTESEKVVQQALDEASKGRTCIVIAHRLKTVVNAHKIIVIHKGVVVEEGTHEALLERKGFYWKLYSSSSSSNNTSG